MSVEHVAQYLAGSDASLVGRYKTYFVPYRHVPHYLWMYKEKRIGGSTLGFPRLHDKIWNCFFDYLRALLDSGKPISLKEMQLGDADLDNARTHWDLHAWCMKFVPGGDDGDAGLVYVFRTVPLRKEATFLSLWELQTEQANKKTNSMDETKKTVLNSFKALLELKVRKGNLAGIYVATIMKTANKMTLIRKKKGPYIHCICGTDVTIGKFKSSEKDLVWDFCNINVEEMKPNFFRHLTETCSSLRYKETCPPIPEERVEEKKGAAIAAVETLLNEEAVKRLPLLEMGLTRLSYALEHVDDEHCHGFKFNKKQLMHLAVIQNLSSRNIVEILHLKLGTSVPATVSRHIRDNRRFQLEEGFHSNEGRARLQVNCDALAAIYREHGAPPFVILQTDATALQPRLVHVPTRTDHIVYGFDTHKVGIPRFKDEAGLKAILIDDPARLASQLVVFVAVSPFKIGVPYVVLAFYASNSSFTTADMVVNLKIIATALKKAGITLIGLGSDGDGKLLRLMKDSQDTIVNRIGGHTKVSSWLQLAGYFLHAQDVLHFINKFAHFIRTPGVILQLGDCIASVIYLQGLGDVFDGAVKKMRSCEHLVGLAQNDRQSVKYVDELCSNEVIAALGRKAEEEEKKGTDEGKATAKNLRFTAWILRCLRHINDAFVNPSVDIEMIDRVKKVFTVFFFLRGWKASILPKKFVTNNTFDCLQILAHTLVGVIRIARDNGCGLKPWELGSQRCESTFKLVRANAPRMNNRTIVDISEAKNRLRHIHFLIENDEPLSRRKRDAKPAIEISDYKREALSCKECTDDALCAAIDEAANDAKETLRNFGVDASDESLKPANRDLENRAERNPIPINPVDLERANAADGHGIESREERKESLVPELANQFEELEELEELEENNQTNDAAEPSPQNFSRDRSTLFYCGQWRKIQDILNKHVDKCVAMQQKERTRRTYSRVLKRSSKNKDEKKNSDLNLDQDNHQEHHLQPEGMKIKYLRGSGKEVTLSKDDVCLMFTDAEDNTQTKVLLPAVFLHGVCLNSSGLLPDRENLSKKHLADDQVKLELRFLVKDGEEFRDSEGEGERCQQLGVDVVAILTNVVYPFTIPAPITAKVQPVFQQMVEEENKQFEERRAQKQQKKGHDVAEPPLERLSRRAPSSEQLVVIDRGGQKRLVKSRPAVAEMLRSFGNNNDSKSPSAEKGTFGKRALDEAPHPINNGRKRFRQESLHQVLPSALPMSNE